MIQRMNKAEGALRIITGLTAVCFSMAAVPLLAIAPSEPPPLAAATPIDLTYLAEFGRCDRENVFDGVQLPVVVKGRRWFGCSDRSRLARLDVIASQRTRPLAVVFTAKLARDNDGSPTACGGARGPTDQCGTSLMLLPTAAHRCVLPKDALGRCVPVDASNVPYVAIPASGPSTSAGRAFRSVDAGAFRRKTGIRMGDFAVVRLGGRAVAAVVADAGPWNKIGEGSAALLARLQPDGSPRTVGAGVEYVVFPGSGRGHLGLSPDDIAATVSREGCARYRLLVGVSDAECR